MQLILFQDPILTFLYYAGKTFIYWFPPVGAYVLWTLYMMYIQAKWVKNIGWSLLEIKIPKQITKSPAAMEMVISSLYQPNIGSLIDQYIKGRVRSWFSMEIVSIGGTIHFFIRTEKKFRNLIESTLYSQYADIEVSDADDYANKVPYGLPGSDWEIFGLEFKLAKPDPYPIKTYVDYGLDQDPKEELKVDPMTPLLEFFGSIGPGEQLWFQIMVMATQERFQSPTSFFKKEDWKKQAEREVDKIMKRDKPKDTQNFGALMLSPGERQAVEAIQKSFAKYGFDTGIRAMYLGKGQAYNGLNVPRLISCLNQFNTQNLNSFKAYGYTSFDYPWQDYKGMRLKYVKWKMFDFYRRRAFFYPPAQKTPFVLNSEELATVFHFPGQVATTPTLERISSKRGEPPPNLPI